MGFICIHGHFYQPPRENPWLEAVELQESAHPYHDWNQRINAECYAPNAASRILDDQKRILRIVNNYTKISFNFGPTLLSWLEENDPSVYGAILDADQESRKTFPGHGSALAQPYNHMIMPLANERDKHTQALWGIRDFEHRFGRQPEGMWLPETAVDLPTLEALAQFGIKFTVLAPSQASRIRKIGGRSWKDVSSGRIDPTMVYRLRLHSGRSIHLFFYDGPIAKAVAFEGLLDDGERFAKRLVGAFSEETRPWPELVNIATDGETYGHHHRYGEMALTYALNYIESQQLAELTNYGLYLEHHPPTHGVEIFENTSWSCAHGVGRWRSNCGCSTGGHAGWNQEWRAPLRAALDWLRDTLAPLFEEGGKTVLKDPWAARDDYIDVVLNRSPESRAKFLAQHAHHELNESERVLVWKLMELQRHAMLMYTSCGWFFDELSGIETVQVIQYAGRAVQLADELFGDHRENLFLEKLSAAKSNVPEYRDGGEIYRKFVKPAFVDLRKVSVHYGIRSLFERYDTDTQIYQYRVERQAGSVEKRGDKQEQKLAIGRARFTSRITEESQVLGVAAFDRGDYNPVAGVLKSADSFEALAPAVTEAFSQGRLEEVASLLNQNFEGETYSATVLFRDEQQRIVNRILESEWQDAEASFERLHPQLMSMLRILAKIGAPVKIPRAYSAVAEYTLNARLRRALDAEKFDIEGIRNLLADAASIKASLDATTLEYAFRLRLERMAEHFQANYSNFELLKRLATMVDLACSLPFQLNFWKIQNTCYQILQGPYQDFLQKAQQGDTEAKLWVDHFAALAGKLFLHVA